MDFEKFFMQRITELNNGKSFSLIGELPPPDQLTDAFLHETVEGRKRLKLDGTDKLPTVKTILETWEDINVTIDLASYKKDAMMRLDIVAENVRSKYITAKPGQVAIYDMKLKEATEYINSESPVEQNFPLLQADAAVYNISIDQAAHNIILISNAWTKKGAQIEQLRLTAKRDIRTSTSITDVDDILQRTIEKLNEL